jgi:hypothetical protein
MENGISSNMEVRMDTHFDRMDTHFDRMDRHFDRLQFEIRRIFVPHELIDEGFSEDISLFELE